MYADGLALLGAYVYGDLSPEDAHAVYGTLGSGLEKHVGYTRNVVVIQGGHHARFGYYGKQRGDPAATLSSEEQQGIAVQSILEFIRRKRRAVSLPKANVSGPVSRKE